MSRVLGGRADDVCGFEMMDARWMTFSSEVTSLCNLDEEKTDESSSWRKEGQLMYVV